MAIASYIYAAIKTKVNYSIKVASLSFLWVFFIIARYSRALIYFFKGC